MKPSSEAHRGLSNASARHERREAARPLGAGRRHLTRYGGGGELVLGLVFPDLKHAAAAEIARHAADGALEDFTNLGRLQVAERVPRELGAFLGLGVGAVEEDNV